MLNLITSIQDVPQYVFKKFNRCKRLVKQDSRG